MKFRNTSFKLQNSAFQVSVQYNNTEGYVAQKPGYKTNIVNLLWGII